MSHIISRAYVAWPWMGDLWQPQHLWVSSSCHCRSRGQVPLLWSLSGGAESPSLWHLQNLGHALTNTARVDGVLNHSCVVWTWSSLALPPQPASYLYWGQAYRAVLTVTGMDILLVKVGPWWPQYLTVSVLMDLYTTHLPIHKKYSSLTFSSGRWNVGYSRMIFVTHQKWGLEITHSMKCCYTVCRSDHGSPALVKSQLSAAPVLGWRQRLPGASGQSSPFVSFSFHENPCLRKIQWTCVSSYTWTCTYTIRWSVTEGDMRFQVLAPTSMHTRKNMHQHTYTYTLHTYLILPFCYTDMTKYINGFF